MGDMTRANPPLVVTWIPLLTGPSRWLHAVTSSSTLPATSANALSPSVSTSIGRIQTIKPDSSISIPVRVSQTHPSALTPICRQAPCICTVCAVPSLPYVAQDKETHAREPHLQSPHTLLFCARVVKPKPLHRAVGPPDKKKTADDNDNDIILPFHHTAGPYPPACRTTHRQKDNRIVTSLVPDRLVHKMDSIILCSRVHFYFWSLCLFFFGSVQLTFCSGRAVEKFLWRSVLVSTRHYQNRKKFHDRLHVYKTSNHRERLHPSASCPLSLSLLPQFLSCRIPPASWLRR